MNNTFNASFNHFNIKSSQYSYKFGKKFLGYCSYLIGFSLLFAFLHSLTLLLKKKRSVKWKGEGNKVDKGTATDVVYLCGLL